MAVFQRPDSPFWWVWLEGWDLRESTKIPHTTGSPKQDAENRRQAQAFYAKRMAALALQPKAPEKPVISFHKLAAWYAEHHAAHLRGVERVNSMLRQLEVHFDRFASVAAITSDDIKEWMTARKRQVSPSTVNRELDVLKSVLRSAVPRYLDASPARDLRRLRVEEAERRVLTPEEEARLLAVGSPADHAWIVLALDTLLRLANTVYLKWAQVKLDRRVIVPLNAKVAHDIVPISTRLHAALSDLPRDSEWVFPAFHDGDGSQGPKQRAIRRFDALCALARVPHGRRVDGVTFHCLRHTGATRALQRGASVRTVMKLGGWKDERSVMRYVHASDADVRAAAELIAADSREPDPLTE